MRKLDPARLSVAEKAGQVMMCGFLSPDPNAAREAVLELGVGGVIYFSRNLGTLAEVRALSAALQSMAQTSSAQWPLFIATDQEGGPVSRLSKDVPRWPPAMALSAASLGLGDTGFTQQIYYALGRELAAAGINVNFSPVLDVNDTPENPVIGVRSFGDDAQWVGALGQAAVQGLTEAQVMAVGKHFPGHGHAKEDSHAVLPRVERDREALSRIELGPFRHSIHHGIAGLMTAHVVYPALDPDKPATLSPAIIQGVLRDRLQFGRLVFTDCMEMSAIAKGVGTASGAVLALRAGADMVLISHSPAVQQATHAAICEALASGELPMQRIDEALGRIAAAKARWCTRAEQPLTATERDAFARLRENAYGAAVTVVHDAQALLPLPDCQGVKLVAARDDGVLHNARKNLGRLLQIGDGPPTQGECHTAVVLVRGLATDAVQAVTMREIARRFLRTIVVAVGAPYDLAAAPPHTTQVCTYSTELQALAALAKLLSGQQSAVGKLPVRLSQTSNSTPPSC
ncbi:MAG: beta-N-acetylhexosaminidase [Selenomonadales bacterium]|nr:beta-N-acetylhexosaminidase [Selenomonadales bacterium]